jgi:hypothetical protein
MLVTVSQPSDSGGCVTLIGESVAEVDLHHRDPVAGPNQRQQHRHRRGLEARVVPTWGIVASELGGQVDQQPGPRTYGLFQKL